MIRTDGKKVSDCTNYRLNAAEIATAVRLWMLEEHDVHLDAAHLHEIDVPHDLHLNVDVIWQEPKFQRSDDTATIEVSKSDRRKER